MQYILRSYQKQASDAAVSLFLGKNERNGLLVLPTGAGKSLVIADIASRINGPLLVMQPSKEILEQNYKKLCSYGVMDVGVFSASVGRKDINRITFATIGTVINKLQDFRHFKYILWDECHNGVNPERGMAERFIHDVPDRQVIGLTATPYRLTRTAYGGSMLKFLTRCQNRIFDKVIYYCQIGDLLSKGYLADLEYYDLTTINLDRVRSNTTGSDYDDESLKAEYERSCFFEKLTSTVTRVLKPKSGVPRNGVLVFTSFVRESEELVEKLSSIGIRAAIVSGNTPKKEREQIVKDFKTGNVKVVSNVGTLTTGFDYPELDTIILARPTKSLGLYYQMVGRAIRPHRGKNGWIIDLGGNYKRFGNVADLMLWCPPNSSRWAIYSKGRQLTNIIM